MKNSQFKLNVDQYNLPQTGVEFSTTNTEIKTVFDECEALCRQNIKTFGDYDVLIEGAKYNGVWLETQPIGGEMYAKRDLKIALANILIFLRYQRRDGKFPGMISNKDKWSSVAAHYDWMQGCFLPYPALKLYYLIKDKTYLEMLYEALKDFDYYLWSCRDSTGDGCLENWCIWDVGEDNCTVHMLHGLRQPDHGAWGASTPPKDYMNLPHKSPQYMAYSYAIRTTLMKISQILDNGQASYWEQGAKKVQDTAIEKLWDDKRHAFFLKDKNGQVINSLNQENIKCMYCGLFTQEMADQFIKEHLFNKEEFYTPYPFPSIAANDPYFHVNKEYSNCADKLEQLGTAAHDIDDNSWSGPINGLVWLRCIEALLNYGYHAEVVTVGKKILSLLANKRRYVQNYNPFTGQPAKGENGYGPTILSALEYISLICGINIRYGKILWSVASDIGEFEYTQKFDKTRYTLKSDGKKMYGYINNKLIFTQDVANRVETDLEGNVLNVFSLVEN